VNYPWEKLKLNTPNLRYAEAGNKKSNSHYERIAGYKRSELPWLIYRNELGTPYILGVVLELDVGVEVYPEPVSIEVSPWKVEDAQFERTKYQAFISWTYAASDSRKKLPVNQWTFRQQYSCIGKHKRSETKERKRPVVEENGFSFHRKPVIAAKENIFIFRQTKLAFK
jgi:hypothetical protein